MLKDARDFGVSLFEGVAWWFPMGLFEHYLACGVLCGSGGLRKLGSTLARIFKFLWLPSNLHLLDVPFLLNISNWLTGFNLKMLMPMEAHRDLCHVLSEPFLVLLSAVCLVTDLWSTHKWWSRRVWPALLNCLRPSWLEKETLEPEVVGFSLAFCCLWQSLLALCECLPICA